MKRLTTVVLFVVVLWANAANAHAPYPNPTPRVRLTGMLFPLDTQSHSDRSTLTVFIRGQQRLWRLETVEELTARERDWTSLQDLFHRQVRLYGADDLMRLLQQPARVGQLLTIEGRLYPRERRFLITAGEEATEVTLQNQ